MDRNGLIAAFQDTLKLSTENDLGEDTKKAIESSKVYCDGFVSAVIQCQEPCEVEVKLNTTFAEARKYVVEGRVAVLNFANPENPGGGVEIGAMAQEECLCRSSNLYSCLCAKHLHDEYYGYHRNLQNHFYSDRLIYTRDVTVFKDDEAIPNLMNKNDWFKVDVITCAAPYLGKKRYTNPTVLKTIFRGRIRNIFEAALDNKVDVIALGAFGCGAFKNPAQVVAETFKSVIEEYNYCSKFKRIVFAIKKESDNDVGRNYRIFSNVFEGAFSENNPSQGEFLEWQQKNPYYKKQISILGDSISTLEGYNPQGYSVFYTGAFCAKAHVSDMKDTWWGKVIDFFGGELLVNDSWSGSRVTKLPDVKALFPSGCSDERTSSLHINSVLPAVIIIYLGTNDWAYGVKLGEETRMLEEDEYERFEYAYEKMVEKLKTNYPESEIWCCTLSETYIEKAPDFRFPHRFAGKHIEEYNDIIRRVSREKQCKLIDLYEYKMPYDSIDGSHPTEKGMRTIATIVIREMAGTEVGQFLDCENNHHEYVVVEEYTGSTKYVCKKCAEIKWKNHCGFFKSHMSHIKPLSSTDAEKNRNFKNIQVCVKGHFFDGNKYDICPHCKEEDKIDKIRKRRIRFLWKDVKRK